MPEQYQNRFALYFNANPQNGTPLEQVKRLVDNRTAIVTGSWRGKPVIKTNEEADEIRDCLTDVVEVVVGICGMVPQA